MKRLAGISTTLVLLIAVLSMVASAGQQRSKDLILARSETPSGLPIYTGSHVLIVGIDKYKNLPKSELKYCVNDAKEFRDVLVDYYGFAATDVTVLTDDQATLANIRSALSDLADPSKVKSDDRVLVYFSGHGQTVRDSSGADQGYLIPSDAQVDIDNPKPDGFKATCLAMQEVWDKLDPSPAKHIAVIADACFSGLLTKSRALGPTDYSLSAYLTMPARQAICAGGRGQKTWETDKYRHGIFTYELLQELKRRAKDKQQVFPLVEVFAAVLDPVVQMSKGRQVPQYSPFYTEGQMLFFAGGNKAPPEVDKPEGNPKDKPPKVVDTTPARLTVTSSPDGASVWVDDEQAGTAPLTKEYPITDKKKVHVKVLLPGYEKAERDVQLKPNKESKVNLKLKKSKAPKMRKAHLTITSNPSGAAVSIDGESVGVTPYRLERDVAEATQCVVHVSLEGYQPSDQQALLDPTKDSTLDVQLKRIPPVGPFQLDSIGSFRVDSTAREIRFSPDGRRIAVVGQDQSLTIYDAISGRPLRKIAEPPNRLVLLTTNWDSIVFVSLLSDGQRRWASVLVQNLANDNQGSVYSADMADSASLNYAWSDGATILVCGQSGRGTGTVASIDTSTGKSEVFTVPGVLRAGVASGDDSTVALFRDMIESGTATNLLLLRGADRSDQQQVPITDSDVGQQVYFSPSGDLVAVNTARRISSTTAESRGTRVFEVGSGRSRFALARQVALGFVDHGTKLVAWSQGGGGVAEVFDASTGASLGKAASPRLWLSSDGQYAASQSSDGTVSVSSLRLNSGTVLATGRP